MVPILASMLFGLGCAYLLAPQQSEAIPVTPIPETLREHLWQRMYFVVLIAIERHCFYFLLKRKSKRIIKGLIVVALDDSVVCCCRWFICLRFYRYFPSIDYLCVDCIIHRYNCAL